MAEVSDVEIVLRKNNCLDYFPFWIRKSNGSNDYDVNILKDGIITHYIPSAIQSYKQLHQYEWIEIENNKNLRNKFNLIQIFCCPIGVSSHWGYFNPNAFNYQFRIQYQNFESSTWYYLDSGVDFNVYYNLDPVTNNYGDYVFNTGIFSIEIPNGFEFKRLKIMAIVVPNSPNDFIPITEVFVGNILRFRPSVFKFNEVRDLSDQNKGLDAVATFVDLDYEIKNTFQIGDKVFVKVQYNGKTKYYNQLWVDKIENDAEQRITNINFIDDIQRAEKIQVDWKTPSLLDNIGDNAEKALELLLLQANIHRNLIDISLPLKIFYFPENTNVKDEINKIISACGYINYCFSDGKIKIRSLIDVQKQEKPLSGSDFASTTNFAPYFSFNKLHLKYSYWKNFIKNIYFDNNSNPVGIEAITFEGNYDIIDSGNGTDYLLYVKNKARIYVQPAKGYYDGSGTQPYYQWVVKLYLPPQEPSQFTVFFHADHPTYPYDYQRTLTHTVGDYENDRILELIFCTRTNQLSLTIRQRAADGTELWSETNSYQPSNWQLITGYGYFEIKDFISYARLKIKKVGIGLLYKNNVTNILNTNGAINYYSIENYSKTESRNNAKPSTVDIHMWGSQNNDSSLIETGSELLQIPSDNTYISAILKSIAGMTDVTLQSVPNPFTYIIFATQNNTPVGANFSNAKLYYYIKAGDFDLNTIEINSRVIKSSEAKDFYNDNLFYNRLNLKLKNYIKSETVQDINIAENVKVSENENVLEGFFSSPVEKTDTSYPVLSLTEETTGLTKQFNPNTNENEYTEDSDWQVRVTFIVTNIYYKIKIVPIANELRNFTIVKIVAKQYSISDILVTYDNETSQKKLGIISLEIDNSKLTDYSQALAIKEKYFKYAEIPTEFSGDDITTDLDLDIDFNSNIKIVDNYLKRETYYKIFEYSHLFDSLNAKFETTIRARVIETKNISTGLEYWGNRDNYGTTISGKSKHWGSIYYG